MCGMWYVELTTGETIPFYSDKNGEVSPLERIEGFDQGDVYSMDIAQDAKALGLDFDADPDEDSYVLVPKSCVSRVFYRKE